MFRSNFIFIIFILCCGFATPPLQDCERKAKQAWGVGRTVAETDYLRLKILPQKVKKTALEAYALCQRGYSLETAVALAKQRVEKSYRSPKTKSPFFVAPPAPSAVQKGFEITLFSKDF